MTEFDSLNHDKLNRLEDSRNLMKLKGIAVFDEAFKYDVGDTVVPQPRGAYYAVTYGNTTGIFRDWKHASCYIKSGR